MTPQELKRRVTERGSLFFSKNNMKWSGDTMRNYGVRAQPRTVERLSGGVAVVWELYRRKPVNQGLYQSAFFDITTFEQVFPKF
jgi:hypothetical protein